MKIGVGEVEQIVRAEVLKREIVEGEEAEAGRAGVSKFYRKGATPRPRKRKEEEESSIPPPPEESVTQRLLREAQEQETTQPEN